MSVEDKALAMKVRREVVRRSLDASRLYIHSTNGNVELGGTVAPARKGTTLDLEAELEIIKERVMRMPGVRDLRWTYLNFAR